MKKICCIIGLIAVSSLSCLAFFNSQHIYDAIDSHSRDLGFVLEQIAVDGHNDYCVNLDNDSTLQQYEGRSIFLVPIAKIKQELESIDCIENVNIARILPASLHMKIKYKKPVAIWQNDKKFSFITASGDVMKIRNTHNLEKFIIITGQNAPKHAISLLNLTAIDPEIHAKIVSAIWIGGRRWNVKFDNGTEVLLPEQHPEISWSKFINLYKTKPEFQNWQYKMLDFRVENKLYAK